jgi:hypothetical protein
MKVFTVHEVLQHTQAKLQQVEAERDALIAYADSLRKVGIAVSENKQPEINDIHGMHNNFVTLSNLLTINPQQHLAEIRAEALLSALDHCEDSVTIIADAQRDKYETIKVCWSDELKQYAEQIRQGGKN